MLIVTAKLIVENGQRDAVVLLSNAMVVATRAEPGCHDFSFAADPLDDKAILIHERWAHDSAKAEHRSRPHSKAFQDRLMEFDFSVSNQATFDVNPISSP